MLIKDKKSGQSQLRSYSPLCASLLCAIMAFKDSRGHISCGSAGLESFTSYFTAPTYGLATGGHKDLSIAQNGRLTARWLETKHLCPRNEEVSGCSHLLPCTGGAILNVVYDQSYARLIQT